MKKKINLFKSFIYVFSFILATDCMSAIAINKPKKLENKIAKIEKIKKVSNQFYFKTAQMAFKEFQTEIFENADLDLDSIFLKIEKKVIFQDQKPEDAEYFQFEVLTDAVVNFIGQLKDNLNQHLLTRQRLIMQMNFYGLSQAIKRANQMSLTIQSEQFNKLHDILMSQSTSLFYISYTEKYKVDLFWCSYFLHELNYPLDLTAKHLSALSASVLQLPDPEKYKLYGGKLAKLAMTYGEQLGKPNQEQIDVLYQWVQYIKLSESELQIIQKSYLKQLQLIGDTDKIKDFKRELVTALLHKESKNILSHPMNIFKYIQFLIGYVFVAWPLEFILVILSLSIFAFQSRTVLNAEEKILAKRLDRRLWMMFTKSYLGANVPFFSKLAASLILFGVGLYFNSAKNFVESMIGTM
jgi:hypothetical protein